MKDSPVTLCESDEIWMLKDSVWQPHWDPLLSEYSIKTFVLTEHYYANLNRI